MGKNDLNNSGESVTGFENAFGLLKHLGWSIVFFLTTLAAIYFLFFPLSVWPFQRTPSLAYLLSMLFLLLAVRIRAYALVNYRELDRLYVQIEEAEQAAIEQPDKATPIWQIANLTLQTYYVRNLQQNNILFWLSVVIIVAGFCLIAWGIVIALLDPLTYSIAVAAGIGGVITEAIGATCLALYRSTVEQSLRYTDALERTSTVGLALAILETVVEKDSQKSEQVIATKIEIALKLIAQFRIAD